MTTPLDRLAQNYTPAFLAFLTRPEEATLHAAYELGRAALTDDVSLLDLVRTHHTVLGEVLLAAGDPDDVPIVLNAAAGFLVESLAPFEMARRSFLDQTPAGSTTGGGAVDSRHTHGHPGSRRRLGRDS